MQSEKETPRVKDRAYIFLFVPKDREGNGTMSVRRKKKKSQRSNCREIESEKEKKGDRGGFKERASVL